MGPCRYTAMQDARDGVRVGVGDMEGETGQISADEEGEVRFVQMIAATADFPNERMT